MRGLRFGERLVAQTAVGGLASVAGGGKFGNGAVTSAFGYLFNELGTNRQRGYGWIDQDSAAYAALKEINPKSVADNVEYGGFIERRDDGTYDYTDPIAGDEYSVDLGISVADITDTRVGDYHTHGAPKPIRLEYGDFQSSFDSGDIFSEQDITSSNAIWDLGAPAGYRSYLGTPSGKFKAYDPSTKTIYQLK